MRAKPLTAGRLCGQPTPRGPCKRRLGWGALRCKDHLPKTPEQIEEFRAESRKARREEEVRENATFTKRDFVRIALEHGLGDPRTATAYRNAREADDDLKEQIARHHAAMRDAARGSR